MRIFLSGLMGAGKSTVAKAVGEQGGLPVVDLDERIEKSSGSTVPELFRVRGEAAFRQLEAEAIDSVLASHSRCVVALGGGAVTSKALRRRLLGEGLLVTLDASLDLLSQRVGSGEGRPLLSGEDDLRSRLSELRARREGDYAECHLRIDTGLLDPRAAATAILAVAQDPPIVVPLGVRTYHVEVGRGIRDRMASRIARSVGPATVMLVTDTSIFPRWGSELSQALEQARGSKVPVVQLAPGEAAKTLASVEAIWNAGLEAGLDRSSMIVGVGGGVIGDLSGFAAATLLRGVRVGHVPTTLLAMVDSAIGGKTGFDTPYGKNLVGAIHQPCFVLSDVDVLSTLPREEFRAGLAEVVKSAWIDGETAVAELERDAEALSQGEVEAALRAIRMAARLKARVVAEDEHESGRRAVLNLGHTLGHAIEVSRGYQGIRHGEAVSLGMIGAFRVASHLGHASRADALRMQRLLERLGLPVDVEPYLEPGVLAFMASDKKRRKKQIAYVLPSAPGRVELHPLALEELGRLLVEPVG